MNEQQKALVKATVPVLKTNGVALTKHFYQRMFTHNPELKNIFNQGHQNSGRQQEALAMAVAAYAENIDDPSVLLPVVERIAAQTRQFRYPGRALRHCRSSLTRVN